MIHNRVSLFFPIKNLILCIFHIESKFTSHNFMIVIYSHRNMACKEYMYAIVQSNEHNMVGYIQMLSTLYLISLLQIK